MVTYVDNTAYAGAPAPGYGQQKSTPLANIYTAPQPYNVVPQAEVGGMGPGGKFCPQCGGETRGMWCEHCGNQVHT